MLDDTDDVSRHSDVGDEDVDALDMPFQTSDAVDLSAELMLVASDCLGELFSLCDMAEEAGLRREACSKARPNATTSGSVGSKDHVTRLGPDLLLEDNVDKLVMVQEPCVERGLEPWANIKNKPSDLPAETSAAIDSIEHLSELCLLHMQALVERTEPGLEDADRSDDLIAAVVDEKARFRIWLDSFKDALKNVTLTHTVVFKRIYAVLEQSERLLRARELPGSGYRDLSC